MLESEDKFFNASILTRTKLIQSTFTWNYTTVYDFEILHKANWGDFMNSVLVTWEWMSYMSHHCIDYLYFSIFVIWHERPRTMQITTPQQLAAIKCMNQQDNISPINSYLPSITERMLNNS